MWMDAFAMVENLNSYLEKTTITNIEYKSGNQINHVVTVMSTTTKNVLISFNSLFIYYSMQNAFIFTFKRQRTLEMIENCSFFLKT